jgi:lysophospholipase L1-like esterase
VLVLGDSLTYGDGIEERSTYSRQLERLLRRRWRVEVVNAGIDGAQSEDIVRIARRLIPELQPDLVIYGVCLNDFLPSGVGQYDGSIRLPEFIRSRTRIGPVAELLISNAAIRLGITRDFYDDILHGIPEYRERFARDARDLNSFVREHEIPPVIALVLDQFAAIGDRGQHIAWLAEQALAAAGVTVLNTDGLSAVQRSVPHAGQQMGRSSKRGGQRRLGTDSGTSRRAGHATRKIRVAGRSVTIIRQFPNRLGPSKSGGGRGASGEARGAAIIIGTASRGAPERRSSCGSCGINFP